MTARVIPLGPDSSPPLFPKSSSSRPTSSRSLPGPSPHVPASVRVSVEWDGIRGLHVAVCGGCCEAFTTARCGQAHDWADTHTCDPELAALLDAITRPHARPAA